MDANSREALDWSRIGWAVAALRRVGAIGEVPLVGPPVVPNRALTTEVAWAMATLPAQPWTAEQLRQILDILRRREPVTSTDAFYTLMAAAMAKRTSEFVTDLDAWQVITGMSIGQLDEMRRMSHQDRHTADLLGRHGPAIGKRVEAMTMSMDDRTSTVEEWFAGQDLDDIG
ncbi:hypothetical protein ALI22I_09210 [Saccharothrix sp. ALI-22-I]|uniref:hypothetical protein n=1 Tax=Saccharothrix sp. ALI-22-I TaxID=1933778 RepID=UPI00097C082E|nr:hypothetical protein [Saccharothrix sp. ALI-22-I]ONI91242.1 hypothetical protein ALI22I_09210 [Saccharothrix sp. ALI-22-I]